MIGDVLLLGPWCEEPLRALILDDVPVAQVTVSGWALAPGSAVTGFPVLIPGDGALAGLRVSLGARAYDRLMILCDLLELGPTVLDLLDGRVIVPLAQGPRGAGAPPAITAVEELFWRIDRERGAPDMAILRAHLPAILGRATSRARAAASPNPITRPAPPLATQVDSVAHQPSHLGFFRLDEVRARVPRFDGTMTPPLPREIYHGVDAALVLPYDPVRDVVLLVEQFRFGPWGRGDPHPWTLEPIAGHVDPGEPPEDALRREAMEEAGLRLGAVHHVASAYPSPGYNTDYFYCYVGLCDIAPDHGGGGGVAEEHENIRSHILPLNDALAMCDSGEIDVVPLVMLLLWLARHRDRLRAGA